LQHNPPNAQIDITTHASDWLWAVFALLVISDLAMLFWSRSRVRGQRIFHNLAIAILTTTALAYFAMASDLGSTPIATEFRTQGTRAIWYVRFVEWIITTPMLLTFLFLGSGLALSDLFVVSFMGVFTFVTLLVGALVTSVYKWGFYVFSIAAMFYIFYEFFVPGPGTARNLGAPHLNAFRSGTGILALTFVLYEIAWGVSEGGNVISPTGEMVFYGILDLLSKPVFLFWQISRVNAIEYGSYGFGANRGGAIAGKV